MYLCTIMKVHRSFVGDGWITYNIAYRRKAASSKNLDWSQVDFTLYNKTFTGRPKSVVRVAIARVSHTRLKSVLMLSEALQLIRTGLTVTVGSQFRSVVTLIPAVGINADTDRASLHTSVQNATALILSLSATKGTLLHSNSPDKMVLGESLIEGLLADPIMYDFPQL